MDFADVATHPKEPRPQQARDEAAAAAHLQPPREEIGDDMHNNRGTAVDVSPMEAPQRPVRAAKAAAIKKLQTKK